MSERQREVLRYIKGYRIRHGNSPSIREIMDNTGIKSTSNVLYILDKLVEQGLITVAPFIARSYVPTDEIRTYLNDKRWTVTYMVTHPNGEFNIERVFNTEVDETDEDLIRREAVDIVKWHLEGKLKIELLSIAKE